MLLSQKVKDTILENGMQNIKNINASYPKIVPELTPPASDTTTAESSSSMTTTTSTDNTASSSSVDSRVLGEACPTTTHAMQEVSYWLLFELPYNLQ